MGFTIDDALIQTGEQYKLTLLAGKNGCGNAINWVHMIEDDRIIQQLWGKELVVTTGLGFQDEESLMHLVQLLVKHHCVGLLVNTGKYIFSIPQYIIDYCEEQDLPLLTTPWEIYLADIIKDYSMRCIASDRQDRQISRYFKQAFLNPDEIEETRHQLSESFDVDGNFQIIMIDIEHSENFDTIERQHISVILEICFEKVECNYSFFWYNGYFVLIVNNLDEDELDIIVDQMYKRTQRRMNYQIHIGISTQMKDFRNIYLMYKRARAAVQMASTFHEPILFFDAMGVYQILFSIDDTKILSNMYHQLLNPLLEYDKQHKSELIETFYQYLIHDGNQLEMSKDLFMHRNTINYRMNKIKEILNNDLSSFESKISYMIAFYIKNMLDSK